jgi:NAD(P) transhydrogenase subunit beta
LNAKVVIVPGYGLAVAQAQGAVAEIAKFLREQGKDVKFAVHPVRLPSLITSSV